MLDWVREVQDRGAGEIVLNCMGSDGVRRGYDIEQLRAVREICHVPLVASGGAGTVEHFTAVFRQAGVDAALAASVFHTGAIAIPDLKRALRAEGIEVTTMNETATPGAPLALADIATLDFDKTGGLLPAIVQHAQSGAVLMLGYMNREALRETLTRRRVVFFSRSRQCLWEKGETSGHTLSLVGVRTDCDRDTLLVTALPAARFVIRAPPPASAMTPPPA